MIAALLHLGQLLVLVALATLVVMQLSNYPFVVLFLILLVYVGDSLYLLKAPVISLGSLTLYAVDLATGLAFAAGLLRLLRGANKLRAAYLWAAVVFAAALLISAYRGVDAFGVQTVGNNSRPFFYFVATLILGASVPADDDNLRSFFRLWLIAGWVLIAIALVRWALVASGQMYNPDWLSSSGVDVRVLDSSQTLFLLQVVVIAWYLKRSGIERWFVRLVPFVFIPAIVAMQQRTVWVILLVSVVLLLMFERKARGRIVVSLLALVIIASVIFTFDRGSRSSYSSLEGSAQNTQTLTWRMEGWAALFSTASSFGPVDYVIGQPMGTGYDRYLPGGGSVVTASPHDYYLQVFLMLGSVGILVVVGIFFDVTRNLLRADPSDSIARAFFFLTIAYIIFFITYAPIYQDGFVMGLTRIPPAQ